MIRRLLLLGLAALSSLPASAQQPPLPDPGSFHLFLLVGQSNMAGRGAVEPADCAPLPRVLMLSQTGQWIPAVDPLHFDKPAAGVGLGRTFAQIVAEARPGVTIGLIPCAVGGSPIDTWQPGVFYDPTRSFPWDDMLRRMKIALPCGTLKGILWHQGESDAKPGLAPVYEARLHGLIERFRAALDAPAVPFIAGQIGRFDGVPWTPEHFVVDQAHQSLPQKVPHTAFVSSRGLQHKGDQVHFDSASYRELGRRYARAFLELNPAP